MGAKERSDDLAILPHADHEASFAICRGTFRALSGHSAAQHCHTYLLGARNLVQRSANSSEQDYHGRRTSCDVVSS
jgi:hypothetical protein